MNETNSEPSEATGDSRSGAQKRIFWLFWVLMLLSIPFYIFTALFELSSSTDNMPTSILSAFIGVGVLIGQIYIAGKSRRCFRNLEKQFSESLLWLLGGSFLLVFVWAGGCALMPPLNMH